MKHIFFSMAIVLLIMASCQKETTTTTPIDKEKAIAGQWRLYRIYTDYSSDTIPPDEDLFLIFNEDRSFYLDVNVGTWHMSENKDTVITVIEQETRPYFIQSVNNSKLVLKYRALLPNGTYSYEIGLDLYK
ncbi:MAG: hypothetical protein JXR60_07090 [Bacteroidales bacterium]|nr:hypothetical protein [Bacteroidales bacterium]